MINLYEYQKTYLSDLPSRSIMAADTGTGKTFMALAHYERHAFGVPLLILAPASKIRTRDWERELDEYFKDEFGNFKRAMPEVQIYSYEKFSRNPNFKQFKNGQRAIWHQFVPRHGGRQFAIIADECHRAKNSQSGIGKALFEASVNAPFFVGLSATPLPNGWIDFANYSKVWGFVKNITDFKRRYCEIVTYKGFPEIKGYVRQEELAAQWQSISKRLTKAQALDLPARTFIGVDFKKPADYIQTMVKRINLVTGDLLDSPSALAHALRQTLTKPKLDYLTDLIEGTDENVVIFYNYNTERDAILEIIRKKFGDRPLFQQDGKHHQLPTKSEWATTKRSITLSHYKSGSTGVEMTYATIVIYFSPTYSYAEYLQSIGRVYRNGQKEKTTFYNFRTPNTIEQEVYECLRNKSDFQERQWADKQWQN